MAAITIRDLMTDPELFGKHFAGDTFAAWRALLAGFYGLPLEGDELEHWQTLTGRQTVPTSRAPELWLAVGRRGGKSQAAALLAVFEACFQDHRDKLSPGEVATVQVLSADRRSARAVFRYVRGLLHDNPMLKALITREDRESIELSNRTAIEVTTASFRTARGATSAAVILDEIAFFHTDDSANPDHEILNAVRPSLATLDGPLIALSSPYAKRGELWNAYRRGYGEDDAAEVVAQAASQTMNPTLPQRIVDLAYERDPEAASAEYGGQFREGIDTFIDREQVERLCRPEPMTLPAMPNVHYFAFVDPAGGGQSPTADEFTMAVGHKEKDGHLVVDALYGMKGRPDEIIEQYSEILRAYRVREVTGDRFAGQYPQLAFEKHKIRYRYAEGRRTDLYQFTLPLLNNAAITLPPCERLVRQFSQLERRVTRSGAEIIDHGPGKSAKDDRANAVAGLAFISKQSNTATPIRVKWAR